MRCSSNLHIFSLLHWLTSVMVFEFGIHALSTSSSAPTMTTDSLDGTSNLTRTTFAEIEGTAFVSSSSFVTEYENSDSTPAIEFVRSASMAMSWSTANAGIGSDGVDSSSTSMDSTSTTSSFNKKSTSTGELNNQSNISSRTTASTFSSPSSSIKSDKIFKNSKRNSFEAKSLRNVRKDSSSGTFPTAAGERQRTFRSKHHHEHHWGPFFEEPHNSSLNGDNLVSSAHLFTEAVLNCRVGMLKDKTVMWVKKTAEKVSLLTVGNVTYSGDPRIRVKFQYPNNWRLLINPTQKEDAGIYMCQVSTHPPRVFTTNLTILEPPLRLIDEQNRDVGDRYYKAGSTIDLQCQVSKSFLTKEKQSILKSIQIFNFTETKIKSNKANTATNNMGTAANELTMSNNQTLSHSYEQYLSNFILWAKDGEQLPPSAIRSMSTTDKWLNSRVSITDANLLDSGNYSCAIGKVFTAIVQVQVLSDGVLAAVQHNSATSINSKCLNFGILAIICLLLAFKHKLTIFLPYK